MILEKNGRLAELDKRYQALSQLIEERAAAYADDPIGRSGLYNLRYRTLGSREHPVLVQEYCRDPRELRALLRIERQAAIEMGQWGKDREDTDKRRVSAQDMMRKIEAGRQRVKAFEEQQAATEQQSVG